MQGAALVDGAGEDVRPFPFGHGDGFAAQHAFVYIGAAEDDRAVHGDALAGLGHHGLAFPNVFYGDFSGPAVFSGDDGGRPWLQAHELADGGRGVALGPLFQQPSQQDEGDDDAGRFEIDMGFHAAPRPEFREKEVEDAEQVGHERAVGHQCVHVGRPVAQLPPGVGVEISAEPEHHRRGQQPGHPSRVGPVHEAHPDDGHGQGQCDGPDAVTLQTMVFLVVRLFRAVFHLSAVAFDDQTVS